MNHNISIDEFLSKRSLSAVDGIVYRAAKMPKSFNAAARSARFVMTDESVDSYGDIVRAKGADLERFASNPICLLNHSYNLILGTWTDVEQKGKKVEGTANLAKEGTAPHVDMAFNLMDQGILRGASIGFMPTKVERRLDENGEPTWSYDILEWQLYECSIVSVPANPAALAKSIKDGNGLARDYLEQILDEYVKTPSGIILPRADFEAVHKDTLSKTSVVVDRPEWMDELKDLTERAEKALGGTVEAVPADEGELIAAELRTSVELALREYDEAADDMKDEAPKSRIKSIVDGIRALFHKEPEAPEPEIIPEVVKTPIPPEQRAALLERASRFAPAD